MAENVAESVLEEQSFLPELMILSFGTNKTLIRLCERYECHHTVEQAKKKSAKFLLGNGFSLKLMVFLFHNLSRYYPIILT